jgi:hypothetical protein
MPKIKGTGYAPKTSKERIALAIHNLMLVTYLAGKLTRNPRLHNSIGQGTCSAVISLLQLFAAIGRGDENVSIGDYDVTDAEVLAAAVEVDAIVKRIGGTNIHLADFTKDTLEVM